MFQGVFFPDGCAHAVRRHGFACADTQRLCLQSPQSHLVQHDSHFMWLHQDSENSKAEVARWGPTGLHVTHLCHARRLCIMFQMDPVY